MAENVKGIGALFQNAAQTRERDLALLCRIPKPIAPPVFIFLAAVAALTGRAGATLTAPSVSTGTYTVSWTEPSGGQQRAYLLQGSTRITVTGRQSRSFTNPPGTYTYRLLLCFFESETHQELCDPPSPEVTVLVTTATVPGTPSNLVADPPRNSGSFSLSWTTVGAGIAHYDVEERVDTGAWSLAGSPTAPPLARNRPDGTYSYRVRACTTACGGYSNVAQVTVLRPPGVPGSLGPDETEETTYFVRWGAASGTVTRYELKELAPGQTAETTLTVTGATSRVFRERDEGTYRYRVRACNDVCSAFTAFKRITVLPAANITGPTASEGVFTLRWTLPSPAERIAQLETRRGSGNWHVAVREDNRLSTTLYRVCSGCEGEYQFRLRFCEPDPEPGPPEEICGLPGRVHPVTVTHPTNTVVSFADVPICSDDHHAAWERAVSSSQGVIGRDPYREDIGFDPENKEIIFSFANWFPVDGHKHTLCGPIHRFEVYDGLGDEIDHNHFVVPNASHAFILQEALSSLGQDVQDCGSPNNCMEAEVTPDGAFFGNPWFFRDTSLPAGASSVLTGREGCFYGPWVIEWAHGDRPEIHPSELAWWKSESTGPKDVFRLFVLQDDSHRFVRWASPPMDAEFRIAFETPVDGPEQTFDVFEEDAWKRNVLTSQDPPSLWDADDDTTHTLVLDGRTLIVANERQTRDDDIGVRFRELCQDGGRLRGYVSLRTRVGLNMSGSEGFHSLRVERLPAGSGSLAAPAASASSALTGARLLRPTVRPRSARRVVTGTQAKLVMDLEVGALPEGAPPAQLPAVTRATVVVRGQRTPVAIGAGARPGLSLLREVTVPITEEAVLELQLDSGETVRHTLPPLGLVPRVATATPADAAANESGWPGLVKAVKGKADLPAPPRALQEVRRYDLRLTTGYAPLRHGRPAAEEDSAVSERLNETLREGEDAWPVLFGSGPPITTGWSFTATDLTTGARVSVVVGAGAGPRDVRVEIPTSPLPGEKVSVTFPNQPAGHLFEVVATAKSHDVFGASGDMQQRLWSYVLAGAVPESLVESLLPTLSSQAGRPAGEWTALAARPVGPDPSSAQETESRQARILRGRLLQAAADRQVTVEELDALLRFAERLRR
jgi:hypothetical protein